MAANYLNQLKNLIVENVSKNSNFQNVVTELNKVNKDLKTKGSQWNKQAHTRYKTILKNISSTQKNLDKEVSKALVQLKKSAGQVEKNLITYKKKAMAQKSKLEKMLNKRGGKGKSPRRAGAPRKRTSAKRATATN